MLTQDRLTKRYQDTSMRLSALKANLLSDMRIMEDIESAYREMAPLAERLGDYELKQKCARMEEEMIAIGSRCKDIISMADSAFAKASQGGEA